MKVILMKSKYGYEHVWEYSEDNDYPDDYVPMSRPMNIEFDRLEEQEITQKQVDAIDKAIEKEKADSQVKVNAMTQRKQELLSICYDGENK